MGEELATELEAGGHGARVRVKLPRGNLEGNITQAVGPQAQVRGVLKCMENGIKTHRMVTERVDRSACRVVEDLLTWHDRDISADVVQQVEFQREARNQSDYLDKTVVEMMLKWGLFGHTVNQGLMPCSKRHWVASVWEYTFLLGEWETVKHEEEPLVSLLQLLSQQGQGEARKREGRRETRATKFLPVDPALDDNIFVPIHLKNGKHWLLASIDVQAQKMQLFDCLQRYGRQWRGQIHNILRVWFLASVRKLRATGAVIKEELQWGIDICTVDLKYYGSTRAEISQLCSRLEAGRLEKRAPDITQLLGGETLSSLAALNTTVDGGLKGSQLRWCWSSGDAKRPATTMR
jgi:hypothetical protein